MAFNEWVYGNPLQLQSTNPREIDGLVVTNADVTKSTAFYRQEPPANQNVVDVYPVVRSGTAPDEWWVLDPSADVPTYSAGPDITYDIALGFREQTYNEARAKAKDDLFDYYRAFKHSFFEAPANTWYSASVERSVEYLEIANFVLANPGNIDYWVFDVDGDETHITTQVNWDNFQAAWRSLFGSAQINLETAWTAIKAGSTVNDVRVAMAALPAIPTVP